MRAFIAASALLMLAGAANAQPWGGGPGYGFGPPRPVFDHGYGRPWGWGGSPRRCWWIEGYYGPRRVCRGW